MHKYRGVEFAVVRSIRNDWRRSIKRERNDKTGIEKDRDNAVRRAQKFIDELLKSKSNQKT